MTASHLDRDLIPDPSIYDMLVRVGRESIDVAIYSAMVEGSLLYLSVPAAAGAGADVRALENAVYDNPLMLADFRRVYLLLDTPSYVMIPPALDAAGAAAAYTAIHPGHRGPVHTAHTGARNAAVAYAVPAAMQGFIGRTYGDAAILPHMAPLITYFASKPGLGNSRRMICNFRRTALDILVLEGTALVQANTFDFHSVADAVYYILASRHRHRLDAHTDEVLVAGDAAVRDQVMPMLRTYVARVMPVIFPPQMFRAGRDALQAPFDLIVTPLCE